MPLPSFFRMPRPKTFLHFVSLRTATEYITLTIALNKLSGLYGLLALLTGYHLNPLQLSSYVYSLFALALVIYLAPHIRLQSPLQCLALAWFYALDSAVNAVYTSLFGISWFILLAQHISDAPAPGTSAPGGSTMNDTAGFTDAAAANASREDVTAAPADHAIAPAHDGGGSSARHTLGGAVFQSGSMASITVIAALWATRLYCILVVFAYARGVLRQHLLTSSSSPFSPSSFPTAGASEDVALAENPFRRGREEGEGWRGALGRAMTRPGRRYWLGREADDEWVRGTGRRFERLGIRTSFASGVGERERRARSGTGPPPVQLKMEKMRRPG
ncbi:hypothetical protein LTR50_003148 [Elasticomyces elasticus]|nr:hypothetical protein LTR50_003148 [Elasticomyces elasticus]